MLENKITCPNCGAVDTLVWRHVFLEHADIQVRDELEVIEVVCTECEKTVSMLSPRRIKLDR